VDDGLGEVSQQAEPGVNLLDLPCSLACCEGRQHRIRCSLA